jgi:hypothetical protein
MIGTLNVETDFDFSLELNGTVYSDSEFSIDIDSMGQLESIQVMGPFGSPSGGKTWEILTALEAIKANPSEYFSNLGGNRGAMWHPRKKMEHEEIDFGVIPSSERYTLRSERPNTNYWAVRNILEQSDIVWTRYGTESIHGLTNKILDKLKINPDLPID